MNIGIVTTWFENGAGHVSKSYERVLEKQCRVFIYARGVVAAKNDPKWDCPNVTWAPHHPCSTGIHKRHFVNWVKKHSIDTIIFNEQRHWTGVVLARELGVLTGAYVDYYTADTVPFFDLYDFLICNTRRHYSVFQHHPQSCYCAWGTDVNVYKPMKHSLPRPVTFIISAGLTGGHALNAPYMDRRGVGMAIRAFRKIQGNCRLVVLSQVPLEGCPEEWQIAVKEDKRIEFRVGSFNPVPYLLGDVYVYPSRLDGIGLTLPEALSCGLPAITTNVAPMNEFVYNGENGILVDVKEFCSRPDGYYWPESICDENSLENAFKFYVDHPEQVISQGAVARSIAVKKLDWDKNADFIAGWVKNQRKITSYANTRLDVLAQKAILYDYSHNSPTVEKIKIWLKSLPSKFFKKYVY